MGREDFILLRLLFLQSRQAFDALFGLLLVDGIFSFIYVIDLIFFVTSRKKVFETLLFRFDLLNAKLG